MRIFTSFVIPAKVSVAQLFSLSFRPKSEALSGEISTYNEIPSRVLGTRNDKKVVFCRILLSPFRTGILYQNRHPAYREGTPATARRSLYLSNNLRNLHIRYCPVWETSHIEEKPSNPWVQHLFSLYRKSF